MEWRFCPFTFTIIISVCFTFTLIPCHLSHVHGIHDESAPLPQASPSPPPPKVWCPRPATPSRRPPLGRQCRPKPRSEKEWKQANPPLFHFYFHLFSVETGSGLENRYRKRNRESGHTETDKYEPRTIKLN